MTSRNDLYAWLGKRKLKPRYETSSETNRDGTSRFVSVLSVDGLSYRTEGRAVRRSDAEEEAAYKFILLLRSQGKWDEKTSTTCTAGPMPPAAPQVPWDKSRPPEDNLKSLLNLFVQKNGTKCKYDTEAADGQFRSRLTIEIKLGRPIDIQDTGSSKVKAELACASRAIDELERRGLMDRPPTHARERASAQADGPRLERSVSMPPASASAKWDKTRPMQNNPTSLLNEFLQKNGVLQGTAVKFETQEEPNGMFSTRLRIDLERQHGVTLVREACAFSKTDSKKDCAVKVIHALENLGLIEPRPIVALSDAPGPQPSTVSETLNSYASSISSALERIVLRTPATCMTEEGAVGGQRSEASFPLRSELTRTHSAGPLSMPSTVTNYHAPVIILGNTINNTATSDTTASARPSPAPVGSQRQRPIPERLQGIFESSEMVTDRDILRASGQIGDLRRTIGRSLGLTEADIDNCMFNERDPYEMNRRILNRWRDKESRNATLGKLCKTLWHYEAYDAVIALGH